VTTAGLLFCDCEEVALEPDALEVVVSGADVVVVLVLLRAASAGS
jgi:hypothetical protein